MNALILTAVFVILAWRSWFTWPDIVLDFGRELYIPWRLAAGDVLYRDILFTMGPLSQYFNAAVFLIFGESLTTLVIVNLLILAAITAMVFRLFRSLGTTVSALGVTLFFLLVFAFGQYTLIGNYNYVCPYRHEVTHGLALSLAMVLLLLKQLRTQHNVFADAAGVCLGLTALTKLELFLPALGAFLVWAVLILRSGTASVRTEPAGNLNSEAHRSHSGFWSSVVLLLRVLGAAAIPVFVAVAALAIPLGWQDATSGVFSNFRHSLNPSLTLDSGFYRSVSGLDTPALHLANLSYAALLTAIGIVAALTLEWLSWKQVRLRKLLCAAGSTAGLSTFPLVTENDWKLLPTPIPLVLMAVIVILLYQNWRRSDVQPASAALLLTSVYSLLLLPKILLKAGWAHYGFVLAMPGTLVFVHLLIHELPEWLRRRNYAGIVFQFSWAGILMACALSQFLSWNRIDGIKIQPVGSGSDTFFADPYFDDRVLVTVEALRYLNEVVQPEDTLSAIPEGATLNHLLRKRNPSGYLMLNPWELDVHGGEPRALNSFSTTKPTWMVLVSMDLTIFGRGNFGSPNFGASIDRLIAAEYTEVNAFSNADAPGGPTFQIVIYRNSDTLKASQAVADPAEPVK